MKRMKTEMGFLFREVRDSQSQWKHWNEMAHIQSLFYTFIWTFAPELVELGYIYASVPPLYKIPFKGGYKYLKDDKALAEYRRGGGSVANLKRLKGLGEMNTEDLEDTMLNKDNRILKQITLDDAHAATALFERLMGDSAAARKSYIETYSGEMEVFV
jgi:DNA gyrase subunit B